MPKTINELKVEREAAGKILTDLGMKLGAEGYAPTAEDEEAFDDADKAYNAALAVESAEVARCGRASAKSRVEEDAKRLNAEQKNIFRPDYKSGDSGPNAAKETAKDTNPARPPARPRRHGALRAFKGADASERAEVAGLWAAAALYGDSRAASRCAESGIELTRGSFLQESPGATLTTFNNGSAGYFVPNEIEYAVIEYALQYGVFRQYADVVPMGSGTKDTPRWTGGMTAYWVGEGAAPSQVDPAWDLITLVAKNLAAMTKMTRQLDEDSAVDLGDKITMALAEAFTYAEDNAGFNGDGTSTYGGVTGLIAKILANAAAYSEAVSGNVTDITLDLDDFNKCVAKLPNYPGLNPAWFMHKTVWANSAQRLQMALGGVVPADVQAGARPMLLGYPVVFTNVLDSTPATGEIAAILGDLRFSSKLGTRRGMTVESGLINDDFTKQLMTIMGTQRVAINNHTVTDPRSSSNPGPVIGLKLA